MYIKRSIGLFPCEQYIELKYQMAIMTIWICAFVHSAA